MDVYLDSTNEKRIDLCMEFNAATYETKQRRFVVRHGNNVRSFENLIEAVEYYKGI